MGRRGLALAGIAAAIASLAGGCAATTSRDSLLDGSYSGIILASGQRVTLVVSGTTVQVDGTEATLEDPTTTAAFHLGDGAQRQSWSCVMSDATRSAHCTITSAVSGNATPCPRPSGVPDSITSGSSAAAATPSTPATTPATTPAASASASASSSGASTYSRYTGGGASPLPQALLCAVVAGKDEVDLLRVCSRNNCL